MTGHTVNHIFRSSEPPMSNRVIALNSFVPLAREVVSVLLLYRVIALMEKFYDRLPALFVFVKTVNRKLWYLSATLRGDASCKG